MRLALNLVPMPFLGKLKASAGGQSTEADAAFAFGIAPIFDYNITSMFFIGASPTYTFNVKGKDATDSAKELDLLLRVGANFPAADKLTVYGYLSPGYSIIQLPSSSSGVDNPAGLVLGFHAGAQFDVAPTFFLQGQLGYQIGFQKTSVGGMDVDLKTSYLQIGLGGGIRL